MALDTPSRPAARLGQAFLEGGADRATRATAAGEARGRYIVAGIVLVVVLLVGGLAVALVTSHSSAKHGLDRAGEGQAPARRRHDPERQRRHRPARQADPGRRPRQADLAAGPDPRRRAGLDPGRGQAPRLELVADRQDRDAEPDDDARRAPALRHRYLTLKGNAPLRVSFKQPISMIAYGTSATDLKRRVLASPQSTITLPRSAPGRLGLGRGRAAHVGDRQAAAGQLVPAGLGRLGGGVPVARARRSSRARRSTLTFSKPVSKALGNSMPALIPVDPGQLDEAQRPHDRVPPERLRLRARARTSASTLPHGVQPGRRPAERDRRRRAAGRSPAARPLRLQQLLANLGYLPLKFNYHGDAPATTPAPRKRRPSTPPKGSFDWRYANSPQRAA